MRVSFAMPCALLACAMAPRPVSRFVPTDASFEPAPLPGAPRLLIDQADVDAEPPFKAVGVLEVQGSANDTVNAFLARVSQAGSRAGCEVVEQRDLFERMTNQSLPSPPQGKGAVELLPARTWIGTDEAIWQFLCGVRPASRGEAIESYYAATRVAASLRDAHAAAHLCERYIPTGSHIARMYCGKPVGAAPATLTQ